MLRPFFSVQRTSLLAVLSAVALLSACAETKLAVNTAKEVSPQPSASQMGAYKIGKPYQIDGTWYYPAEDWNYVEEGVGSWYGPNFHGKMTANGEEYDQMDLTAAHRTLPMPSLVRVTNLDNGRSLVVRINDRGPFAKNRIIDLSKRSAELLGYQSQGTARVRVELLADESRILKAQAISNSGEMPAVTAAPRTPVSVQPLEVSAVPAASSAPAPQATAARPPQAIPQSQTATVEIKPAQPSAPSINASASASGGSYVQAGAFSDLGNAQRLQNELQTVASVTISPVQVNGRELYRVRLGPLSGASEADRVLAALHARGLNGARVIVD